MKAPTMLDTIQSLLGTPACAIPLSFCKPAKTYLLAKVGISCEQATAILFAIPYVMTSDAEDTARNISLYAVPKDYHGYLQELNKTMLPILECSFPANRFAIFADHSPICEVDAAARAGLGVMGLNGLLITPRYGSFVFLAEIITDADFETVTGQDLPCFPSEPPLCEECGACLKACPAGCRLGERAGCLSALTQKKGDLTADETDRIQKNGLVWGCDACQLSCPHNIRVIQNGIDTPIPYFRENRLSHLDTAALDTMSDVEFASRAYAWRGRSVIRRNLLLMEHDQD